jgi:hypothetical protein
MSENIDKNPPRQTLSTQMYPVLLYSDTPSPLVDNHCPRSGNTCTWLDARVRLKTFKTAVFWLGNLQCREAVQ